MPKPRNFEGFGVVTRQGHFLWQYSRATEEETRKAYEAHNPQIEGHGDAYEVKPIKLKLFN